AGCQSSESENGKDVISGMTAKEIIDKDVFISITPSDIAQRCTPENPAFSIPEARAAAYRFYKQVSFDENQIATCKVSTGAEIKISEELFASYLRELESSNEWVREDLAKGVAVSRSKLDDDYFDRLLDEDFCQKQLILVRQLVEQEKQKK
ncbi:MAG: hypothetical protein Q4D36_02180, partial [Bacteroidales bacterium]|nr:hypothetical protein [Bacteroidales bacterium]